MTCMGSDYMPLDRQLFGHRIADALAALLAQRYPTAKQLARGIGVEPATAENLRKGHLSVPTLEKAVEAGGRELWNKLGDAIFGEPDAAYQARRIAAILSEAENAITNLVQLSSYAEVLPPSANILDPAPVGRAPRAAGRQAGQEGRRQAEGARDRDSATVEPRSFSPRTRGRGQ
jgi:hypothetical protein